MLQQLGVSDSLLGAMGQRGRCDMAIFVAMALLTLALIYCLIFFVKPWLSSLVQ